MPEAFDLDKVAIKIREILDRADFRFYDIKFNPVTRTLRVFIDHKDGVTIKDCKMVSNLILAELKMLNLNISLEVSSPGIERILTRPEHYQWARGKMAELTLNDRKIRGYIRGEDNEGVKIFTKDGEIFIHYNEIINAKVVEEISYGKRRNY